MNPNLTEDENASSRDELGGIWHTWSPSNKVTPSSFGTYKIEWQTVAGGRSLFVGMSHEPHWRAHGTLRVTQYRWVDPLVVIVNLHTGQLRSSDEILNDPEGKAIAKPASIFNSNDPDAKALVAEMDATAKLETTVTKELHSNGRLAANTVTVEDCSVREEFADPTVVGRYGLLVLNGIVDVLSSPHIYPAGTLQESLDTAVDVLRTHGEVGDEHTIKNLLNVAGFSQPLRAAVYRATIDALRRIDIKHKERAASQSAACKTLAYMGYTFNGGELWKPPLKDTWKEGAACEAASAKCPDAPESSGGGKLKGDHYYRVTVVSPISPEVEPYSAECADIIEALGMTFNEGEAFKAIWRLAAARQGRGKPGNKPEYDADKAAHYGVRIAACVKREG